MASLTIKEVDDVTLERLGELAAVSNRSLQATAADILRGALKSDDRARSLRRLADELATMTLGSAPLSDPPGSDSLDLIREDRAR